MLPLIWIDELFKRFEAMYGNQFRQKWDGCDIAMVKQEWADSLDGISGDRIKAALQACREQCKFAPSAPEFYQLCKQQRIEPCHLKLLSKPKTNSEVGLAKIAEIREMLAKKLTATP